ncbi:MAG: hypothetical protein NTY03_05815 [Candidatus Bathyarchaeota archaeon]|nr:hypothetical protein [Candidatus Bathyarchaeota archaeon]
MNMWAFGPLVQAALELSPSPIPAMNPDFHWAVIAGIDVVGPHSLTRAPLHIFMRQDHRPFRRGSGENADTNAVLSFEILRNLPQSLHASAILRVYACSLTHLADEVHSFCLWDHMDQTRIL